MATQKIAAQKAAIVEAARAGKSLREIGDLPGMPCRQTIKSWRKQDPEFDVAFQGIDAFRGGWPRITDIAAAKAAIVAAVRAGHSQRSIDTDRSAGLVCSAVVSRWKRKDPEFAAVVCPLESGPP